MNLYSKVTLTLALSLTVGACSSGVVPAALRPTTTTAVAAPETFGLAGQVDPDDAEELASSGGVPLSMLNHAVLQRTVATTICKAGYSKTVRPPTSYTEGLRAKLLAAYGLAPGTPVEIDHVVAIEDGGGALFPNLYPEPLARAKEDDKVENRIHAYICDGRMKLAEGRRELVILKTQHGYRPEVRV